MAATYRPTMKYERDNECFLLHETYMTVTPIQLVRPIQWVSATLFQVPVHCIGT